MMYLDTLQCFVLDKLLDVLSLKKIVPFLHTVANKLA